MKKYQLYLDDCVVVRNFDTLKDAQSYLNSNKCVSKGKGFIQNRTGRYSKGRPKVYRIINKKIIRNKTNSKR